MISNNTASFIKEYKFVFILVSIGLLVFVNSLFNGFIWDDESQIITIGTTGALPSMYYRALMATIFSLIYSLVGNRPLYFHLFSVVIYISNSILVYFLFKEFLLSFEAKRKELISFIIALFFLLHPLYSEVAFYASNLQDTLFIFFGLSSFLLALKKNISIKNIFSIFLLFLFSLLSKETGLILIFIIFLYLYLFKREEKKSLLIYIVGFASIAVYSLIRFGVSRQFLPVVHIHPITRISLVERLINLPKILLYYIQNFFVPIDISVNQNWIVKSLNLNEFYIPLVIDLMFFGLIFYVSYWLWRNKNTFSKLYFFFLSWFLLALSIHLNIFPLDATVTGRWLYLSSIGLFGMLMIIVLSLVDKIKVKQKKIVLIIILLILIIFGVKTFIRSYDWRDGLTFSSKEIKLSKDNFLLENSLAVELYYVGRIDEAGEHWEKACELAPYWDQNFNNLGYYWQIKGDFEKAEENYLKSIENGHFPIAYENYVIILLKQKKYDELKEFLNSNYESFPHDRYMIKFFALSFQYMDDRDNAFLILEDLVNDYPTDYNRILLNMISNGDDLSGFFNLK